MSKSKARILKLRPGTDNLPLRPGILDVSTIDLRPIAAASMQLAESLSRLRQYEAVGHRSDDAYWDVMTALVRCRKHLDRAGCFAPSRTGPPEIVQAIRQITSGVRGLLAAFPAGTECPWPPDLPPGAILEAMFGAERLARLVAEATTEPPKLATIPASRRTRRRPAPRLVVRKRQVYVDGELVRLDLTPEARAHALTYLSALTTDWQSDTDIVSAVPKLADAGRLDKLRKKLPPSVTDLLETDQRFGARIGRK